jgi:hypothetical protein
VLNHKHVQLNRSLSHCISQENHLEYHIISTLCTEEANTSFHLSERMIHPTHGLPHTGAHNIPSPSQRGTTHPTHGIPYTGAHNIPSPSQRGTTHPTHGLHHLTQGHNIPSLSQRGTTHPSHGHTQLMGSLSGRLTQSVSWRMSHASCNHQHSLSAREAFSTRPSLSRKYSNFVLASGLVKMSAICSWVGRYCTCIVFLCTMSLI